MHAQGLPPLNDFSNDVSPPIRPPAQVVVAPVPTALMRTAITAMFALGGFLIASWAVRIPDVSTQVGATHAALGAALLCVSLGALATMRDLFLRPVHAESAPEHDPQPIAVGSPAHEALGTRAEVVVLRALAGGRGVGLASTVGYSGPPAGTGTDRLPRRTRGSPHRIDDRVRARRGRRRARPPRHGRQRGDCAHRLPLVPGGGTRSAERETLPGRVGDPGGVARARGNPGAAHPGDTHGSARGWTVRSARQTAPRHG